MENNQFLLTIAIPTFNGSKTIKYLLDILLPQIDKRVEMIIIDNCSNDGTSSIILDYKKRYNSINYIRNENNIGPDGNFLKCMKVAKGKFTYLVSDDDILIENSLVKILDFLELNDDISLAYLETVGFKNHYSGIENCHVYTQKVKRLKESFTTTNKKVFMDYAIRNWGFLSSYLWRTDMFKNIYNPEKYFNTYWLQSYIHIECTKDKCAKFGVIKGPIIAAGQYKGVNNFDVSIVDGINYRNMINFAIQNGYNKRQLSSFWLWRICFLGRNSIIKEKNVGIKKTSKKNLFILLWKYPYAWIMLFPFFFVPKFVIKIRNRIVGYKQESIIKRT